MLNFIDEILNRITMYRLVLYYLILLLAAAVVLSVSNRGVATSGTYVRGQHIYNPKQADRLITDIVGLTVIGPDIYEADRFATAAFAMGREGIHFIERLEGFEGYMIDRDGQATLTSGFTRYVYHA